jgi:hypothetical protein
LDVDVLEHGWPEQLAMHWVIPAKAELSRQACEVASTRQELQVGSFAHAIL